MMAHTYWHKQYADQPLYPSLLWDKPETSAQAGKILIVGGDGHNVTAPASAYNETIASGAGVVQVLLPESLKPIVGQVIEHGVYGASTKSGSFSRQSLSTWLDLSEWADGVLLPGDIGRNSETTVTLELFLAKFSGIVTITKDALDHIVNNPDEVILRSCTVFIASFAQLQRLGKNVSFAHAFTYDMPLSQLVEKLHLFTTLYPTAIILRHSGVYIVAKDGEVSTTKDNEQQSEVWRVANAAKVSVWSAQNPSKLFAALTTAVYESLNIRSINN